MKKIIIFGATGNVGSYVWKYAREYFDPNEYEVIASGRRKTDFFEKQGVSYYSVDFSDKNSFDKLPRKDVYAVIDLAAQIPSYMKGYQPEKYVNSNLMGGYNLLEYCREVNVKKFVFSTTVFDISLYELETPGTLLKPDMPYNFDYAGDHAVYVITKNTMVEFLKHYYAEYGMNYYVFRFPTIYSYSPYHYYHPNGVKTLRPVYRMIDLAKKGEPIELWGNPNYKKDMVHVYDCAQMLCKSIETNKEYGFYNVGTGKPVTLQEQIETIIDVFSPEGKKSEIIYRPEKKAGGGFVMDISNAIMDLGYEPKYDCRKLFEDYKAEMAVDRFKELRGE